MRIATSRAVAIAALALAAAGPAQAQFSGDIFMGTAVQAPIPLAIIQDGQPTIRLTARYSTGGLFQGTPYYGYRVAWRPRKPDEQGRTHEWAWDFMHHKLYLTNRPPEVQHFEITHGYNFGMITHAWIGPRLRWRVGGGVVVTHPETIVRNQRYAGPYVLSGLVMIGGVGRRWKVYGPMGVTLEGRLTAAYATAPIAAGQIIVPNLAAHVLVGVGFER